MATRSSISRGATRTPAPTSKHKPTAKRKPTAKPSTALARRKPAPVAKVITPEVLPADLPPDTDGLDVRLSDEPIALTLGTIKFTKEEDAVLNEPVPVNEILLKPGRKGPPQIYLSHPTYIRWFNRAFGRGQWSLMQLSKPQKAGGTILIPYALMVRGVALFSCYGAAEYFEGNAQQTYDDVIESTHAYALRRFAKRLGVGLEMWDKAFIEKFLRGSGQSQRRQDPQEYHEEAQQRRSVPRDVAKTPPARTEKPVASHPDEHLPITTDQAAKLWSTSRRMGRPDTEVVMFLTTAYGVAKSKELKRSDYENVMRAIEHPGPLQMAVERMPGEDG